MSKTTQTTTIFLILCGIAGIAAFQIMQTDFWIGIMLLAISLKLTIIYSDQSKTAN